MWRLIIIRSRVHLGPSSAEGEESVAVVEEDRVEPLRFLPSSFSLMLLVVSISPAPDSSSWNRRNIFWRWLTCFLQFMVGCTNKVGSTLETQLRKPVLRMEKDFVQLETAFLVASCYLLRYCRVADHQHRASILTKLLFTMTNMPEP